MLVERAIVPDAPAFEPIETWPGLTDMSRLQKMLWAAKRPVMILGGSRWSDKAWAATQRFAERFDLAGDDHLPARASVRPDPSQLRRRSRHRPQSETARAHQGVRPRDRWSAAGWARCRARATRCSISRRRSRPSCMCIPDPEELGRVYRPHSGDQRVADRLRRGARRPAGAEYDCRGPTKPAPRMPTIIAFTEKATEVPGAVNLGEIMVWLREQSSRPTTFSATAPAISPAGCIASIACAVQHLHRPDLGLDGLRRAGRGRDEAALSGAQRVLPRGRWRLPDERAGIHDRGAIRSADRDRDRRQRHVRHHPHASGARISRPGGRRPR